MNRLEYLLQCAGEEAAEVTQRASKANRFTLDEVQPGQPLNNWERLVGEFHDLFTVMILVAAETDRDHAILTPSQEVFEAKCARIEKFMELSAAHGALHQ